MQIYKLLSILLCLFSIGCTTHKDYVVARAIYNTPTADALNMAQYTRLTNYSVLVDGITVTTKVSYMSGVEEFINIPVQEATLSSQVLTQRIQYIPKFIRVAVFDATMDGNAVAIDHNPANDIEISDNITLNSSKIDNNYISDIQVISTTHLTKTIEALQITSDYDMGHFLVLLTKEKLSRGYDTDDDIYIEIVSKSSKIFVPAFSTQFDSSHTHQVHGEIYYVP